MAEGIRIRHATLRPDPTVAAEMIIAVRDLTEPLTVPPPPWEPPGCGVCQLPSPGHAEYVDGRLRRWKTRHIVVDVDGYAIVSAGVYDGLAHLNDHGGFLLQNPVPRPPNQTLAWNGNGHIERTVHHLIQAPITETILEERNN